MLFRSDDYDDYDEDDDYVEDFEEPAEAPAPRREKRRAAPAPVMDEHEEEDDFGFAPVPVAASSNAPATGFTGQILNMGASNKQEVVLFRPGICWSDERCEGFRKRIAKAGFGDNFHMYE